MTLAIKQQFMTRDGWLVLSHTPDEVTLCVVEGHDAESESTATISFSMRDCEGLASVLATIVIAAREVAAKKP